MRVFLVCFCCAFLSIIGSSDVFGQDLSKSVSTLRTTRAEVEKIIGKPVTQDCSKCEYQVGNQKVKVFYSVSPCIGHYPGWNVKQGTVLGYTISGESAKSLSVVRPDYLSLLSVTSDTAQRYFVDQMNAIVYSLERNGDTILATTYMPREQDNALRCKGFAPYNPFGWLIYPQIIDTRADPETLLASIANSYVNLQSESKSEASEYRTYVVIYKGREKSAKETSEIIKRLKRDFTSVVGPLPKNVVFMDGGNRKAFAMEVFILAGNDPPPVPKPQ